MKNFILLFLLSAALSCSSVTDRIDRQSVVGRHKISITATIENSPSQVGNGKFAFGMDITGLQTFHHFNTLSDWGWHSFPLPEGLLPGDYEQPMLDTHGRQVPYNIPNPLQPEISQWLAANPHRANLGRVGFRLMKEDGSEASEADISDTRQVVDLWTGIVKSSFKLEGTQVEVTTAAHWDKDMIGVTVESELISKGRLSVILDFPYPHNEMFAEKVGVYDQPLKHTSSMNLVSERTAVIDRTMDEFSYHTVLNWECPAELSRPDGTTHRFDLVPSGAGKFSFSVLYSPENILPEQDEVSAVIASCRNGWKDYWLSGAALDLSGSTDSRWQELERRVVLSQYIMRLNGCGLYPPQESGLVNNGWYGRFHFEMIWWHGVHYGLWGRWELFDQYLNIYQKFLTSSIARAQEQGYAGARWPKCTAGIDRDWPHDIHATLIWQQPHPIYFAEMDYRLHPSKATLDKWAAIVSATADFMADYAYFDQAKEVYVLGPPLYIVSENTDMLTTSNPAFELGYWRYGLRIAMEWSKRMSVPANPQWVNVLEKLAPLPEQDGVYVTHEGIADMWNKYTFEHPALIGTYGMLPGDGVDLNTFDMTLDKVVQMWDFEHTWGWDFPMLAMAAARTGRRNLAVDMLLHPSGGFRFNEHGLSTGGPFPYLPSNGGLLTAIAMMTGGWDGSQGPCPGFPEGWSVRAEGFEKMQ